MMNGNDALSSQQRQLDHYKAIWPAAIYEEIVKRCAEARLRFVGPMDRSGPSWDFSDAFPRGCKFEQWVAELKAAR
jgi:hypothetical protein